MPPKGKSAVKGHKAPIKTVGKKQGSVGIASVFANTLCSSEQAYSYVYCKF